VRIERVLCAVVVSAGLAVSWPCGVAQSAAKAGGAGSTSSHLDMTLVKPETVGFSTERLERLHTLMDDAVKNQQVAGVVTILARHGKVVDYRTYGMQNIEKHEAMTKDTIFRDYSMTTVVTAVAMMKLYEQG
jgi:CubicO group peptidase (beta-lactamase class C family)